METFSLICVHSFVFLMGVYLVATGRKMYFQKSEILLINTRFSLWVLQLFKGVDERNKKEKELLKPDKIIKMGLSAMFVGGILILEVFFRIMGLI